MHRKIFHSTKTAERFTYRLSYLGARNAGRLRYANYVIIQLETKVVWCHLQSLTEKDNSNTYHASYIAVLW